MDSPRSLWSIYFLKPDTPLYFGTPQKYDGSFGAYSVFPSPSVLYGAIRGNYCRQHRVDFSKKWDDSIIEKIGNEDGSMKGELEIAGPFLGRNDPEIYLPTPLNIYEDQTIFPGTDNQLSVTFREEKPLGEAPWMPTGNLKEFLAGDNDSIPLYYKEDEFFSFELQNGHGRNNNRIVEEGLLFGVHNQRFKKDAGYFFLVKGIELDTGRIFYFGGDRGRGRIKKIEGGMADKIKTPPAIANTKKGFFISFITPAYLKKPDVIKEAESFGDLTAAIIGKPQYVGGYDIKKRKSKPLLKLVPPGSTYFYIYKESRPSAEDLGDMWLKSFSEHAPQMGYGIAVTGVF